MATVLFEQNIRELNFSFLTQKKENGILLTNNYQDIDPEIASPEILFALETAKVKFSADAVYFRYFQDGRAAIPQLYLFDYTQKTLSNKERNRIHIQMWNGYQVPAYIIIQKSSVSVFDSREKPQDKKDVYANEIITHVGKAMKLFQAQDFDNGLFWEEYQQHFKFEQSATKDLIRGLKEVYKDFQEKSGLNSHVALKLLVQSLLIKYLEERDEKSASGYFARTYFRKNFRSENFCATIRNGKLLDLLDQLAEDFNGKIFDWHKEYEREEREAIQKTEVKKLADYLDGDNKDNQYVLWRLYSFSHLPVEVISSVYEELLTDSKDIVYTPEMIVSTLVDECMPLKSPKKDFKLIDVSCGSGIFLVKAYKRIVQWWRYEQWQKTGVLSKPSLTVLNKLLLNCIHGIDIELDAVRLSAFSLALAILDEVNLDPPTWEKLKFPDLSENILAQDFFKFISNHPPSGFDLVIGNPPFNLQPHEKGGNEPKREEYFEKLKVEVGYSSEINIPDENPALHFMVQSMKLLKQDALLCLIQPSGPLLYQRGLDFKKEVFSKYNLLQVIDFTKLADKLWGRKNVATAAVFLQNSMPNNEDILHLVANRTFSNTNRLFLEFDHYDFHKVSKESVLRNPYIWKANLLGGGRIVQLIERLAELPTLGDYLKRKRKENQWVFGDGFIKGKPDEELIPSDFEKKKGGYSSAHFLTDSLCFDPEDFTEKGLKNTYRLKDKYFQWPRVAELFTGPLLLIKKNIGKNSIPTLYSESDISFKNEIIGIHAPTEDIELLRKIEEALKNNHLFRFYLALTSSRSGVSRSKSTLLQKDILGLPYSEDNKNLRLSDVDDLLVRTIISYHLGDDEQKLFQKCSLKELGNFSDIFCKTLNSIYQSEGKSFQLFKILDAGKYYAVHFEYSSSQINPEIEIVNNLEQYINQVIPTRKENQNTTHIQKIMKIYGQDYIILAKPKQLRYWLPSIAIRDADETFADYIKARYHNA
jgi:hypothetical protein